MRLLALLILLALPVQAANMSPSDDIECSARGGCIFVPWHLIQQMMEQNKELKRRYLRLKYTRGCLT